MPPEVDPSVRWLNLCPVPPLGMLGGDYSTKFAPWMALGCLSPRKIYHEIARCVQGVGAKSCLLQWASGLSICDPYVILALNGLLLGQPFNQTALCCPLISYPLAICLAQLALC